MLRIDRGGWGIIRSTETLFWNFDKCVCISPTENRNLALS